MIATQYRTGMLTAFPYWLYWQSGNQPRPKPDRIRANLKMYISGAPGKSHPTV